MESTNYRYELRRGEQIVATGHLSQEAPLEIGDTLTLGRTHGTVDKIGPMLPDGEIRLVVQLPNQSDSPNKPEPPRRQQGDVGN